MISHSSHLPEKADLFRKVSEKLSSQGFQIDQIDMERPWGGFFVINEVQAQAFADQYFGGLDVNQLKIAGKLSPKILLVAPQTRLSWQYHFRRAEIWTVVEGTVGVKTSPSDEEGEFRTLSQGDTITLKQGERHRLIGLDSWGIIAEIWQHTDSSNPSDESDIVRVQDDFGR